MAGFLKHPDLRLMLFTPIRVSAVGRGQEQFCSGLVYSLDHCIPPPKRNSSAAKKKRKVLAFRQCTHTPTQFKSAGVNSDQLWLCRRHPRTNGTETTADDGPIVAQAQTAMESGFEFDSEWEAERCRGVNCRKRSQAVLPERWTRLTFVYHLRHLGSVLFLPPIVASICLPTCLSPGKKHSVLYFLDWVLGNNNIF